MMITSVFVVHACGSRDHHTYPIARPHRHRCMAQPERRTLTPRQAVASFVRRQDRQKVEGRPVVSAAPRAPRRCVCVWPREFQGQRLHSSSWKLVGTNGRGGPRKPQQLSGDGVRVANLCPQSHTRLTLPHVTLCFFRSISVLAARENYFPISSPLRPGSFVSLSVA